MKTVLVTLIATLAITPLFAHGDGHEKKEAGPNGGRVLTVSEPHAEFLVTPDRKVKITFLDDRNKPLPVDGRSASVICGDRSNPTKLTFTEKDGALVSEGTLPDGNDFPTVVQIRPKEGKAATAKFNLNLNDCPTCKYKEYACVCDH